MNFRYFAGALVSIPLLPIMFFQGKKIKKTVPTLPEATELQGVVSQNSNKEIRLLSIGESTIAGVGVATHSEGFTGAMATELAALQQVNVAWRVYARSGYTTKRMTEKILPKIEEKAFDIIVIGTGGNDAFTLNTPSKFYTHVLQLIDNLQDKYKNTPILFINVPPIKAFPAFTPLIKFVIGNLGEILGDEIQKAVETKQNVYYINEKITLDNWIEKHNLSVDAAVFFSDGVHPSKLTYQTWGKEVARYIVQKRIV